MRYRLLVVDLDGTLFDLRNNISERNAAALRAVIEKGIHVAIATGRRLSDVPIRAAQSIGRPVYLILCNGALVLAPDLETVMLRRALDASDTNFLIRLALRHQGTQWYRCYDELDFVWRRPDGGPVIADMPPEIWTDASASYELLSLCNDIIRVRLWASDSEIETLMRELIRCPLEIERYPYPGGGDSYLEFMASGVSKTSAVQFLADHLGLELDEVVAFGDGTNDVEMLASVGLGVAMENATAEARQAARMIAGHHDRDGVAQAIADLFDLEL